MSLEYDRGVAARYRCMEHEGCWHTVQPSGTELHTPTYRLAQDASRCQPGCGCWRHAALRWAYLRQFQTSA